MSDIVWQDPPNRAARASRHQDAARELMKHPGRWALVGEFTSSGNQTNIRKTLAKLGNFEVIGGKIPGTDKHGVWARFVGEADTTVVALPKPAVVPEPVQPSTEHPASRARTPLKCPDCGRVFADRHTARKHYDLASHGGGAA